MENLCEKERLLFVSEAALVSLDEVLTLVLGEEVHGAEIIVARNHRRLLQALEA